MKMMYSASTGGFYSSDRPSNIPDDAVEITVENYHSMLDGQSKGFVITPDKNGFPELIDPPALSVIESANLAQARCMSLANQQIAILKPAVDGGYAKPEHVQLLADWQRYRYELTSVPEQPGWPESPQLPDQPETII
ncbi:TPA: tail fiber assembly protein [Aeromonas veronii]